MAELIASGMAPNDRFENDHSLGPKAEGRLGRLMG